MTPHTTPLPRIGEPTRRRNALVAFCVFVAAILALAGCGIGGEPVDARVASPDAPMADAANDTDVDCPDWANEVIEASPSTSVTDVAALREHYAAQSVVLSGVAEELPATDAELIDAYAVAVADFGDDPMSPGASRRMGEAAADAATVAARSC